MTNAEPRRLHGGWVIFWAVVATALTVAFVLAGIWLL
jgi:hypothetical protein